MNRRTLFGRLATVAAAATVAAHVEPARAEVAVATNATELAKRCLACPWVGSWSSDTSVERVIEQMREFSKHVTEAHGSRVTNSDTVWRRPARGDAAPETRIAEAEVDRLRETPEFQAEITRLAGRMYSIDCDLGGATAADALALSLRPLKTFRTPCGELHDV